jgi:glycosyltransferase involved in cell wall biosynthesis
VRVAVAHDWMVAYAGSERVVEQLLAEFPDARLLTSLLRPEVLPPSLRRAEPSFLQRIPGANRRHEWLVPLMPLAWRLRGEIGGVDAVVSSSHACAKAVRAAPGVPHVCYCHTPMRYAWRFEDERKRFPAPLVPLVRPGLAWFRRWDRSTAHRVTQFVANSSYVAGQIRSFYGREALVVHPPVDTDFFTPDGGGAGEEFLYVGRLISYKRPDVVVDAFATLPYRLSVVGDGHLRRELEERAGSNVRFLGNVGGEDLRTLYRRARALVYPAEEDFGIAMAEAQACGTPVIALASGGAVDIVEPGTTGWLLPQPTVEAVQAAVQEAASSPLDPAVIRSRAERFSRSEFRAGMRRIVADAVAASR